MKYIFLIIGLMGILAFPAEAKERATVISAEITGMCGIKCILISLRKRELIWNSRIRRGR